MIGQYVQISSVFPTPGWIPKFHEEIDQEEVV